MAVYLHPQNEISYHFSRSKCYIGPFVYRLGHQIFILERGVRFPYGLLKIKNKIVEKLMYYGKS